MMHNKYFGMSSRQTGILAGLAGTVCLLFGCVGWFVLQGNSRLFARAPETTPVPQATPTPFVLPTLESTATATPVPYEERIPPGWVQFKTDLVEIWLPADFDFADAAALSAAARERYEEMGLQELIAYEEKNPEMFNLVLADEVSGSALYRTIASVSYGPLDAESLDIYMERELSELPSMIALVDRRNVHVGSEEAIRLVFEFKMGNIYINGLEYVFLDGMTVWTVSYSAEINEYYQQLSTFEKSIQTFRFVR